MAIDPEVRARIADWVEYLKHKHRQSLTDPPLTNEQLAQKLGLSEPTVTNALNRMRGVGLEFVWRMHVKFHVSADSILDDPAPDWRKRLGEIPAPPAKASSEKATQPGRRRGGGSNQ
jgi:transcriptional regulator with XRE-family HTH domain